MLASKIVSLLPAVFLGVAALSSAGCSDTTEGGSVDNYDASAILATYGEDTITAIYFALDAKASELVDAIESLEGTTDVANLEAAQEAWSETRIPWENSEAFLFGPVDSEGFDPRLDSWPVNRTDLDAVLASSDPITEDYVANLDNELRGFHTIEYLLWDDGAGSRDSADIVAALIAEPRRIDYLIAVSANLAEAAEELVDAWATSGGNHQDEIVGAGETSSVYPSQKSALQEMVEGMIGIADEVGNGKMADPLNEADPELVESQFSYNSIADFQNNIRGIQYVYLGNYTSASGVGLDAYISLQDAALDQRFKDELDAAIDAIGDITPPFRDAITLNPDEVEDAIDAVNTVQATLEDDILPLILEGHFGS